MNSHFKHITLVIPMPKNISVYCLFTESVLSSEVFNEQNLITSFKGQVNNITGDDS